MQKVEFIGHLGKDAEVKDFNSNQVINFSVAVTEKWKSKDDEMKSKTTWYECARWGNNTKVAEYLKKGQQVYISGTPSADAYINKDGEAIGKLAVNVRELKLIGGASKTNDEDDAPF